jgi:hypothetical protein
MEHKQRGRVGADGHERSVAERDLAAETGQDREPGDGRHLDGDFGDLIVPERVQLDGQDHDDHGRQEGGAEDPRR